ncbi:MAG: VOC family protein [Caldilineaceae bacterium]
MISTQESLFQSVIHPGASMGAVQLTVADLARAVDFYRRVLGFQLHEQSDGQANLGAGRQTLLELVELPGARHVTHHSGLYHFAVLTPSRVALAKVLRSLAEHQVRIGGSDHLVSEALYLSDPDGNGIEVYRDRPRAEWQYEGDKVVMGGLPLDYRGILGELNGNGAAGNGAAWQGLEQETIIGHMHLHVSNLAAATAFYTNVVGFDLMMEWNGAAFLAAGGYHHHLGINTWAGVGAPPQPADAVGLRHYVIQLPEQSALERLIQRLDANSVAYEQRSDGLFTRDPAQNGILFVVKD